MFIVLHRDDGAPDEFRAVFRKEQEETLFTTIIVPPSTYSILVHDLEDNSLPNPKPAVTVDRQVTVDHEGRLCIYITYI